MQNRIDWINYSKGFGIILVVFGHVVGGSIISGIELGKALTVIHSVIYHFHMPLFFFLSGLFVRQSFKKRGLKDFLVYKIKIILYPYFIWSLIQGIVLIIVSGRTYLDYSFNDLLSIPYLPLQHFWFLYVLFLIFLFYSIVAVPLKDSRLLISIIIIVGVILYLNPLTTHTFSLNMFSKMLIFFVIGTLYEQLFGLATTKIKFSWLFAIILFTTGEVISFLYENTLTSAINPFTGIFSILLLSMYLSEKNYLPLIKKLGEYSLVIYLAHGIFSSGSRIILHDFFHFPGIEFVLILSFVAGIIFPIILYKISLRKNFSFIFELPKDPFPRG